tara:strand:+ start:105 stop:416 length:312 start_codon:yes stop_codon:yes gene_type:complete
MWSIIKWLVWGNPYEKNNLNKQLDIITRKNAVKKIEKSYLNYKKNEAKKKIVIHNLNSVKAEFKEKTTLQSTLNSQKKKKKQRKRNKRPKRKRRKREFLPTLI